MKVVEKIKIHILCSVTIFHNSCRLRDNVEKCRGARPQMATWRRVACWISRATRAQAHAYPHHTHARTHTHTQKYVILNAFPRQQLFRECVSSYVIR